MKKWALSFFSIPLLAAYSPVPTYITDPPGSQLYLIDPVTNTAVQTIGNSTSVPFSRPQGIALSPDRTFGYMMDNLSSSIYYIDTAKNQATGLVQNTTGRPFGDLLGVAISPNGQFAYAADNTGALYYIDVKSNTASTAITQAAGTPFTSPALVAISPDSSFAYLSNYVGTPNIYVIQTATNTATILNNITGTPFSSPIGVAISLDGTFGYITDTTGKVFYVDTATNTATQLVTNLTGTPFSAPIGVAISPDSSFVYVADPGSSSVFLIDPKTNTATNKIAVPSIGAPSSNPIAISPDGQFAYVGGGAGASIYSIDVATGRVLSTSNASGIPFTGPLWVAMPLPRISTTTLSGNNLILANYLNQNAPFPTQLPFALLSGNALIQALEMAAPTRNAFFTFAAQINQIAIGNLLSDRMTQIRFRNQKAKAVPSLASYLNEIDLDSLYAESEYPYYYKTRYRAPPPPASSSKKEPRERFGGIWLGGFGQYSREKSQDQTPSFHAGSTGAILGLDFRSVAAPFSRILGLAAAYAYTNLHENEGFGRARLNQGVGGFYGDFSAKHGYANFAFWGGYYQAHNIRNIAFSNIQGEARMKTEGWMFTPHVEIGARMVSGWLGASLFTLADFVHSWEKGASESGNTPLNFHQKGRKASLARSETGIRLQETFSYPWGTVSLNQKGSYAYQKTLKTGRITAFLIDSPGEFTVNTFKSSGNLGIAEFGVLLTPEKKQYPEWSLSYHGEIGSQYQSHEGTFEITLHF